jgi:hypothetical protein
MYKLHLSPLKTTLFLLIIVIGLLAGDLITQYIKYVYRDEVQFGLERLFNLEGENNLPTWYSSLALLLSSAMLAIIGLHRKQEAKSWAWHWLILAIIFLCLSTDEAASIHEMAASPIHHWLESRHHLDSVIPVIGTAWLLAGIPFAAIVFLVFCHFLLNLPAMTRALFLIAGGLYITGAIGLEALGGRYIDQQGGSHTLTYEVMVATEEGLEMVGVIVFIYALMMYIALEGISLQVMVNSCDPSLQPESGDVKKSGLSRDSAQVLVKT